MKKILKKEEGITLIALVITIIILIILAGISIKLVLGDNGIVKKAQQAKTETEQAKLNEEIGLNETAKYIEDIESGNAENPKPTPEPTITTRNLKAGDYIKYNTGVNNIGENGIIVCRVLYDANSEYGLQIISDKNVEDLTFGGSDWETGRNSYNNVIAELNTNAEKYLNQTYATDARCVGSEPIIQNGTFVNKNAENVGPLKLEFTTTVSGANNMKDTDTNYLTDQTQMKNLNIWQTGEDYWLASRYVLFDNTSNNEYYFFNVRYVNSSGSLRNNFDLCRVNTSNTAIGSSTNNGLRPCLALKSDIKITGGEGTSTKPYTI